MIGVHESGLCEGIVEAAVRRARGRRIDSIRVVVGGHPVDPEVVAQGVQLAAMGTVAEGADLDLVLDPLRARCAGCGNEVSVDGPLALVACQACGGVDIQTIGSDRAVLESVAFRMPEGTT